MTTTKVRKYDGINVKPETKKRVDSVYYFMKVSKNYKSFDEFINDLLDVVDRIPEGQNKSSLDKEINQKIIKLRELEKSYQDKLRQNKSLELSKDDLNKLLQKVEKKLLDLDIIKLEFTEKLKTEATIKEEIRKLEDGTITELKTPLRVLKNKIKEKGFEQK